MNSVGVRLDADRDADEDVGDGAVLPRGEGEPGDLLEGVDDVAADSGGERLLELGGALVAAVEGDPLGREACAHGGEQLAPGADVEVEASSSTQRATVEQRNALPA